ncbi:MAG: TolC family protein, partial [Desulfuromonadaceae bacterium]|nr:TolC family protein [Desulfuromonadaceae bacterium]
MKHAMICLIILIISSLPLYAASSLTLEEALEAARENHPQVIEAKENLHAAEARTGLALASYYPQISIAADWNRGRSFLTALESIRATEMSSTVLYLKQTIYDFGRTAGAVEAARSNREAADKAVAVSRQELVFRVKTAFYLLLVADKQIIAVMETVKAREEVFRQAQEFFTQGISAKVDVARAEANLFSARTALIRAENNKRIARVELANAMGIASLEERSPIESAQ